MHRHQNTAGSQKRHHWRHWETEAGKNEKLELIIFDSAGLKPGLERSTLGGRRSHDIANG